METQAKQIDRKNVIQAAAGILLIALFILLTNPQNLSALLLLVLPMLVAFTSYRLFTLMTELFTNWSARRTRQSGILFSVGITFILLLGSLHQLGLQDFILAIILILGLGWYIRRVQPADSMAKY